MYLLFFGPSSSEELNSLLSTQLIMTFIYDLQTVCTRMSVPVFLRESGTGDAGVRPRARIRELVGAAGGRAKTAVRRTEGSNSLLQIVLIEVKLL